MSDAEGRCRGSSAGSTSCACSSATRAAVTPPEMARELGIPRSTVHRLVLTLEAMGFLRRVEAAAAPMGSARRC